LLDPTAFWGRAAEGADVQIERRLGSLNLRIRRVPDEIWVHGSHDEDALPQPEDWARWSVPAADALVLRPALPDRPVVVSPEQPFHLLPRGTARIFVRVPLFIQLVRVDAAGEEVVLTELPSEVLSDTWWGTFTEGELAYWITTRARRTVEPAAFEPHLAVCPFLLENSSDEALPVERFAVRVAHLTLLGRDGAIGTDQVEVRYDGPSEGSEVHYTGRAPDDAEDFAPLAPPRLEPPRGLHSRTFGRLRALSGWS
jgi:hypothetical protein